MNKIEEIEMLKKEYGLRACDVRTLQILAGCENANMTYEKFKEEVIAKEKRFDLFCMGIAYVVNFIGIYVCYYIPLSQW